MPESFSIWFPWLLSALTGSLAATALNFVVNWQKTMKIKKQEKMAQIIALKQELRHALWLIEYNHGRIRSPDLPNKALAAISTTNVERVLFGATQVLPLKPETLSKLHDYLQQTVYLNSLITEYLTIISSNPLTPNRFGVLMGEIKAICTPENTYREHDPEPSLRVRAKVLMDDLSDIEL